MVDQCVIPESTPRSAILPRGMRRALRSRSVSRRDSQRRDTYRTGEWELMLGMRDGPGDSSRVLRSDGEKETVAGIPLIVLSSCSGVHEVSDECHSRFLSLAHTVLHLDHRARRGRFAQATVVSLPCEVGLIRCVQWNTYVRFNYSAAQNGYFGLPSNECRSQRDMRKKGRCVATKPRLST